MADPERVTLPSTAEDLAENRRGVLSRRQRECLAQYLPSGQLWLDKPAYPDLARELEAARVQPIEGDVVWHPWSIASHQMPRFGLASADGKLHLLLGPAHLGRYRGYALPSGIVVGAEPIAVRANETAALLLKLAGCSPEAHAENRSGRLHASQRKAFRGALRETAGIYGGLAVIAIGLLVLAIGVLGSAGVLKMAQPIPIFVVGAILACGGGGGAWFAANRRGRLERAARVEVIAGRLEYGLSQAEVYRGYGDLHDATSYHTAHATWIRIGERTFAFTHHDHTGLMGALVPGDRYQAWVTVPTGIVLAVVPT